MNFRPSHIPFSRLVDWVEKQLSPEEDAQLRQHLADCSRCRQEVAQVERLLGIMHSDTAVDPPPAVITRALSIFQPRHAVAPPSLRQRIVAALQFDSGQLSPALGLRSGAAASRQLLFSADDYDLDLRITPTEKTEFWAVAGQVLGGDVSTGKVALQGGTVTYQAPLVAPGEFFLPAVAAGEYTLVVHLPTQEITVASFMVGG